MKREIWFILFGVFLLALTFIVNAATPSNLEAAKEKYRSMKAEYIQVKNVYADAKQDWIIAKDRYIQYKNAENLANALDKAKNFMSKACNTMEKYLRMARVRVETITGIDETERTNTLAEIDADIAGIQQIKTDVESATTKEDLKNAANKVKNKWNDVKVHVKRFVGKILSAKIDYILDKADDVSKRIQTKIDELKIRGADTVELEALLVDFNSKVALAEGQYELAKAKFGQIQNVQDADRLFREGHEFIKKAANYLKEAHNTTLKNNIEKLKTKMQEFNGTGNLYAKGNGTAVLTGSGTVKVNGAEGTLTIVDYASDVQVTIIGQGTKTVNGSTTIYTGFDGAATITGSNMHITIEGTNIDLEASGTGTVILTGHGTYRKSKTGTETNWKSSGTVVSYTSNR
ncbi:MAG: hypothetical protein AB1391_02105 [Candidatus Micrarchaeota archaeon]